MTLAINPAANRSVSLSTPTLSTGLPKLILGLAADAVLWAQLGLVSTMIFLGVAMQQTPILIAGESMSPGMVPGDVVVLEEPEPFEDLTGWATTFTTDRGPVTHRVIEITDDGLVTQGDANRSADSDLLDRSDIIGVVRHVVPFIGRPVTWVRAGNWPPLIAWLGITIAAVVVKTSTKDAWKEADGPPREVEIERYNAFASAVGDHTMMAPATRAHTAFTAALAAHQPRHQAGGAGAFATAVETHASDTELTTMMLPYRRDWSSIT